MNRYDLMIVTESERAKVLGDPTRSKMLDILSDKPATVKQLSAELNKAPPTILHHVRKLQEHGFVELVETRKVKNYFEKYYRSTIPKTTEIHILVPVNLSRDSLRELRSKRAFFRGEKFVIEEDVWKSCADHFLSRLGMTDLQERSKREALRIILGMLEIASMRIEAFLLGMLREYEKDFPQTIRRIRKQMVRSSSAIAAYAIDNEEFFGKLRTMLQVATILRNP